MKSQKNIKPENRKMLKTLKIKVRGKFDLNGRTVGTDGHKIYVKYVKPVTLKNGEYDLQEAWELCRTMKVFTQRKFKINGKWKESSVRDQLMKK